MTKRERIKSFLVEFSKVLSLNAIEKELDITKGALQKTVVYNRKLRKEEIDKLDAFINSLIDFYLKN